MTISAGALADPRQRHGDQLRLRRGVAAQPAGHDLAGTSHDLTLVFTPQSGGADRERDARSNDAYAYTGHANANVTDTHNGLNQVTATGGTSLSHDARGNITAIGSASYAYTRRTG